VYKGNDKPNFESRSYHTDTEYCFCCSSHVPVQGTAFLSPGFVMGIMTALTTKMRKAVHPSRAQQLSLSVLISSSAFKRPTNAMAFQTVMMGVMSRAVVSSGYNVCLLFSQT
jgi:hypothetical protein